MSVTRSEVFQAALAAVADAVLVTDESGVILTANDHAHGLFGYAAGTLVGREVEILVPARLRESHQSHRRRNPGEAHRRVKGERDGLVGLKADGTEFPAEISLSPVKTANGWLTVVVVRDMAVLPTIRPDHFVFPEVAED